MKRKMTGFMGFRRCAGFIGFMRVLGCIEFPSLSPRQHLGSRPMEKWLFVLADSSISGFKI